MACFHSPPHLANCRTWESYRNSHLKWMIRTNHPDLKKSNYNADKFKEEMKYKSERSKSGSAP